MINKGARYLATALIAIAFIMPSGAYAIDALGTNERAEYPVMELSVSETFTFSSNVPPSPNYVASSLKSVLSGNILRVNISSSTSNKSVRMRIVNSSGTVLANWKTVGVGVTATLWTAPANTNVRIQLQSTTASTMTAKGTWIY